MSMTLLNASNLFKLLRDFKISGALSEYTSLIVYFECLSNQSIKSNT